MVRLVAQSLRKSRENLFVKLNAADNLHRNQNAKNVHNAVVGATCFFKLEATRSKRHDPAWALNVAEWANSGERYCPQRRVGYG